MKIPRKIFRGFLLTKFYKKSKRFYKREKKMTGITTQPVPIYPNRVRNYDSEASSSGTFSELDSVSTQTSSLDISPSTSPDSKSLMIEEVAKKLSDLNISESLAKTPSQSIIEEIKGIKKICELIIKNANRGDAFDNEQAIDTASKVLDDPIVKYVGEYNGEYSDEDISVKLQEIIKKVGKIEILQMRARKDLKKLPKSIKYLSGLTELKVTSSKISKLPKSMCLLTKLKMLDLTGNLELTELPLFLKDIRSLKTITVTLSNVRRAHEDLANIIDPSTNITFYR